MKKATNKFINIKGKLVIASALILTIPLIVLGLISYEKSKSSLEELGATNLKNSVEITIEMIEALNNEVEKGDLALEEAQEQVKIAILGEMNDDGTRPINKYIDLGKNGYMFILDDNGNMLAHPKLEGENAWDSVDPNGVKSTQELIKTGNKGGGFTFFDWPLPNNENKIEPKVSYAKKAPHWGWTVVSGTYMMDFNEPAKEIRNVVIITIGVSLVVGTIGIVLFSNGISRPIKRVMEQMKAIATGDLTKDQIVIKSKDETGQLAEAMNQMQSWLKDMVSNVTNASETISSQSEELTQSANEVRAGSEQIATTMQELATGSETQANSSSELSSAMQTFATEIDEANRHGERIQQSIAQVLKSTKEGSQLMDASMQQMTKIDQIVHDSVEKVQGLDVQSQEISKLVAVIQAVAEQTNLLALNAAIEAARAGEHGKGFAVVADEVRKLAEQVSASVTDITEIVTNILNETSNVTESLKSGYEEVEQGTNQISATGEKFNVIHTEVLEMINRIKTVTDNLSGIAASSQQMNSSIEEIAAVAEESAAGIEQTSASSEETSSAMQEVAASSENLAQLAEALIDLVRQFKL